MRTGRGLAASVIAAAMLCAGCAAPADKAGGEADAVTLTFANPYAHFTYVPQVESFLDALERVSHGAIAVDVRHEWRDFAPGFEKDTIGDVAAGDVDLAWVGTRAFDLVGETAFEALSAPFLVDSEELEQAILDSDLPARMMDAIDHPGVAPLAVLAGGLRRPFSVDAPMTDLASFDGVVFQSFESSLSADAMRALGAEPVHDVPDGLDAGLEGGTIQGFEKQLSTVIINGTDRLAPYVAANVVLWPETIAIIANADTLTSLSERQRAWLAEAAEQASAGSVGELPDDSAQLQLFCAAGGRADVATSAELARLREAVEPVYAQLRGDAETSAFLDEIERLKSGTAAASVQVPTSCTGTAAPRRSPPTEADAAAESIEGVYRWELTAADAAAAGRSEDERYPWPWVTTVTLEDGTWSIETRDAIQTTHEDGGPYTIDGDALTLTWAGGYDMRMTITRFANGDLRATPSTSLNEEDAFVWTTHAGRHLTSPPPSSGRSGFGRAALRRFVGR